ncbi:hypothetical protein V865_004557 [Kwoniella europaea PYCC6329]|uniref:Uncharacterized protein n=1 Tax=Kwoniella europaea PYCC6329 TaxID=1423913 RepID=A0AAX4KJ20_9TREE
MPIISAIGFAHNPPVADTEAEAAALIEEGQKRDRFTIIQTQFDHAIISSWAEVHQVIKDTRKMLREVERPIRDQTIQQAKWQIILRMFLSSVHRYCNHHTRAFKSASYTLTYIRQMMNAGITFQVGLWREIFDGAVFFESTTLQELERIGQDDNYQTDIESSDEEHEGGPSTFTDEEEESSGSEEGGQGGETGAANRRIIGLMAPSTQLRPFTPPSSASRTTAAETLLLTPAHSRLAPTPESVEDVDEDGDHPGSIREVMGLDKKE